MYVSEKYVELIQESSRNNYPGMASDFAWGRGARIGGYVGVGIGVLVSAVTTRAYKIYKKYKDDPLRAIYKAQRSIKSAESKCSTSKDPKECIAKLRVLYTQWEGKKKKLQKSK